MITIKLPYGEEDYSFREWLIWAHTECVRNGGEPITWEEYRGGRAVIYELSGNEGVLTYAKLKWANL